ncbi:hypothetical protein TNIN_13461 [Trichonephila inaurata madagascariensis]|uniref:Uncharacterized protein n=1 Tax=Trichonephila inaurata madagascariensis TaxID=2747483 RepID=A0A8X7CG99_9ARAC|nr:hypothetical protein TNIN_13461 [Trichonephila inaurata madagascariensis]
MSMVERLNLSKKSFLEYLKLSNIACPFYTEKAQAMITNDFSTDISLKYQQQHLSMSLALGSTCGKPLHLASVAKEIYKECKSYSECDVSAVAKYY